MTDLDLDRINGLTDAQFEERLAAALSGCFPTGQLTADAQHICADGETYPPFGESRHKAAWLMDLIRDRIEPVAAEVRRLRAVLEERSQLRVRSDGFRMTHEAVRTRFGILLPACGAQIRHPVEAEPGSEVTCPFCNGTETPITKEGP